MSQAMVTGQAKEKLTYLRTADKSAASGIAAPEWIRLRQQPGGVF